MTLGQIILIVLFSIMFMMIVIKIIQSKEMHSAVKNFFFFVGHLLGFVVVFGVLVFGVLTIVSIVHLEIVNGFGYFVLMMICIWIVTFYGHKKIYG